ncbi:MAG: hypothetical protein N2C12_07065, partial [Planctomycetales bacterium]
SFDDQLWPVNVTLLVLGGFVTGELVALGQYEFMNLQSAWIWIALLWACVFGVMFGAWGIGTTVARRTQFSLALALLVVAMLISTSTRIALFTDDLFNKVEEDVAQQEKETPTPIYLIQEPTGQRQHQLEHERPVETSMPESGTSLVKDQQEFEQLNQDQPKVESVPASLTDLPPLPKEKKKVQLTPPRKSEMTGKLQRQPHAAQSRPDKVASLTVAQQNKAAPTASFEAPTIALKKRPTDGQVQQPSEKEETTAETTQPLVQQAPRNQHRTSQPQHASLPQQRHPLQTPEVKPSPVATELATRSAEDQKTLEAPVAEIFRKATDLTATHKPEQITAKSDVADANTRSLVPSQRNESQVPTVLPRSTPSDTPKRTAESSEIAASPVKLLLPSQVQSTQHNPHASRPPSPALSRSQHGLAGVGQQRNMDRSELAPKTVSQVASVSARRNVATSQVPDVHALSTSSQPRIPKNMTMAEAPASTLQANQIEIAADYGAQRPAEKNATSGAAQRDSSAAAVHGPLTVDQGRNDFDSGPQQIASEFSNGRASGGGEPKLNHTAQLKRTALRNHPGGAPLAATQVENVALEPTDVAGDGGGLPSAAKSSQLAAQPSRNRQHATRRAGGQPQTNAAGNVVVQASKTGPGARRPRTLQEPKLPGSAAPAKIARILNLPGVRDVKLEDVALASGGAQADPDRQPTEPGEGEGTPRRRHVAGRQTFVSAPTGDGGLGIEATPDAGNPSHKAQRHSTLNLQVTQTRFPQRELAGPKHSQYTRVRNPQSGFQERKKRQGQNGDRGRQSQQLDESIRAGLEFLRTHQSDNGSWSFNRFGNGRPEYRYEQASIHSDVAATGLAVMCFLGAGFDHYDYGEYTEQIQAAVDYLVANQQADGNLYVEQDPESSKVVALYSHAIAATAICEAYGMTRDPKLKQPAQAAIKFIEHSQHTQRGGWRYVPRQSSDTSVTGWMLAALKSADLAQLEVQKKTFKNVYKFLDQCIAPSSQGAYYIYNPHLDSRGGLQNPAVMTAVGLLGR